MTISKDVVAEQPLVQVTIDRAITIFGRDQVVTAEQAAKAWKVDVPQVTPILYIEEVLQECTTKNKRQMSDLRLVYVHGFSLREQRDKIGTDSNHPPHFYDNSWWLEKSEDSWAATKPEGGYVLIDFNARFGGMNWDEQEDKIAKLIGHERAHEALVSEAMISVYQTYGGNLFEDHYHWGRSVDSRGRHVMVGGNRTSGIDVGYPIAYFGKQDSLGDCLIRKSLP